jgi:hypothetical protein
MTPSVDVRRPIGLLWIVIGGLLAIYGVIPHHEVARSLAVDRWWGGIMVVLASRCSPRALRAVGARPCVAQETHREERGDDER